MQGIEPPSLPPDLDNPSRTTDARTHNGAISVVLTVLFVPSYAIEKFCNDS